MASYEKGVDLELYVHARVPERDLKTNFEEVQRLNSDHNLLQ